MRNETVELRGARRRLPEDLRLFLRRRIWWGVVPSTLVAFLSLGIVLRSSDPGRTTAPVPAASTEKAAVSSGDSSEAVRGATLLARVSAAPESTSPRGVASRELEQLRTAKRSELAVTRERVTALRARTARLEERARDLISSAEADAAELAARRTRLERQLRALRNEGKTEQHPDVRSARAELSEVAQLIGETPYISRTAEEVAVARRLSDARAALESVRRREQRQAAELAELDRTLTASGERGMPFAAVVRGADARQAETRAPLTQPDSKGTSARRNVEPSAIRADSSRIAWGISGVLLGLLVGVAAMVVRHFTDPRVYTARQLRGVLNVPVLGAIPLSDRSPARKGFRLRGFAKAALAVMALGGS